MYLFIIVVIDFYNFSLLTFVVTYLDFDPLTAFTIYLSLPVGFFPSYNFLL